MPGAFCFGSSPLGLRLEHFSCWSISHDGVEQGADLNSAIPSNRGPRASWLAGMERIAAPSVVSLKFIEQFGEMEVEPSGAESPSVWRSLRHD
jgi:hypothetical protein